MVDSKWLISRLINSVYVWGLRQDTGPTIDSHRGTLMTNILLHGAGDAPCITSASYSHPAYSYSFFLLRKTLLPSVPLSLIYSLSLSHTHTHTHTNTQLLLHHKRGRGSLHIFFLLLCSRHSGASPWTSLLITNEWFAVWSCVFVVHSLFSGVFMFCRK